MASEAQLRSLEKARKVLAEIRALNKKSIKVEVLPKIEKPKIEKSIIERVKKTVEEIREIRQQNIKKAREARTIRKQPIFNRQPIVNRQPIYNKQPIFDKPLVRRIPHIVSVKKMEDFRNFKILEVKLANVLTLREFYNLVKSKFVRTNSSIAMRTHYLNGAFKAWFEISADYTETFDIFNKRIEEFKNPNMTSSDKMSLDQNKSDAFLDDDNEGYEFDLSLANRSIKPW